MYPAAPAGPGEGTAALAEHPHPEGTRDSRPAGSATWQDQTSWSSGTGCSAGEQEKNTVGQREKMGVKCNCPLVYKRCSDVGGNERALVVASLSKAFLLCPRHPSSWLEANSEPMVDAVKTLDHVSLQDGENPDVGVMLKTLENRPRKAPRIRT